MARDHQFTENEINARVNSNQKADQPKSAHATPVVEKYVKKRSEKANKQAENEQKNKSMWDEWSILKYVIL
ncbi:MAG: hypothetical protein V4541_13950 [Bacteroidota bacterium]